MKLHFTESSMILPNDSTIGSLTQSRIDSFRIEPIQKRISHSIENFKSPYQETKPLKFPKNRLRKQCSQTILTETNDQQFRACIRTSEMRNREFVHEAKRLQKSPGTFHRLSRQSGDGFLKDVSMVHSRSLEIIQKHRENSKQPNVPSPGVINANSPNKQSRELKQRKHFRLKAAEEVVKDPILIGETPKQLMNMHYKKIVEEPRVKRYYGEGFKGNLEWKVNSSKEKDQFNMKHSQIVENSYKNLSKKEPTYSSRRLNSEASEAQRDAPHNTPSSNVGTGKLKSYKDMYNSRRRVQ